VNHLHLIYVNVFFSILQGLHMEQQPAAAAQPVATKGGKK
jgi:hypothetical protein